MNPLAPNAFGIQPRRPGEADPSLAAGGWEAMVRRLDDLLGQARRDAAIAWASGRWRPGQADPERYAPGDVVALRAFSVASDLARVCSYQDLITSPPRPGHPNDRQAQRGAMDQTLLSLADTSALFSAVPHFLDGDAAMGILASRPPSPHDVAGLHLPYPRIAVYFGRVLELGPEHHDWPPAWDHVADLTERPTAERSAIGDLRAMGGGIEGVVLAEAPGGGLGDEVLWLVSANPDPTRPEPSALDRYRGLVWGRLSSARLAPVAHNLAATLAWAEWKEPDRALELPADVGSTAWRKSVRRGDFRRREPRGDAAGVRVLDVARTPVADRVASGPAATGPRTRPTTHLRRAHWRSQPVGVGLAERRLVRVPATVVNPGVSPLGPVVYRVPAPEPSDDDPEAARVEDMDLRTIELPDPLGGGRCARQEARPQASRGEPEVAR